MVTAADILTIPVTPPRLALCRWAAQAAELGGRSQVRGRDRGPMLREDQLTGQIGTLAGCLWLTGGMDAYIQTRWVANQHPMQGDGGSDVLGANLDFKASLMRGERGLLDYRLAVRPQERHAGHVYVLVLVAPIADERTVAHIVGWVRDEALPERVETSGVFTGAFVVRASELQPVPPLVWWRRAA